jgi:hypothetical protein
VSETLLVELFSEARRGYLTAVSVVDRGGARAAPPHGGSRNRCRVEYVRRAGTGRGQAPLTPTLVASPGMHPPRRPERGGTRRMLPGGGKARERCRPTLFGKPRPRRSAMISHLSCVYISGRAAATYVAEIRAQAGCGHCHVAEPPRLRPASGRGRDRRRPAGAAVEGRHVRKMLLIRMVALLRTRLLLNPLLPEGGPRSGVGSGVRIGSTVDT